MMTTFYILIGISLLGVLLSASYAMYNLYKEEKSIDNLTETKKRLTALQQRASARHEVLLRYKEQVFEIEDIALSYNDKKEMRINKNLSNSEEGSFEYQY